MPNESYQQLDEQIIKTLQESDPQRQGLAVDIIILHVVENLVSGYQNLTDA